MKRNGEQIALLASDFEKRAYKSTRKKVASALQAFKEWVQVKNEYHKADGYGN